MLSLSSGRGQPNPAWFLVWTLFNFWWKLWEKCKFSSSDSLSFFLSLLLSSRLPFLLLSPFGIPSSFSSSSSSPLPLSSFPQQLPLNSPLFSIPPKSLLLWSLSYLSSLLVSFHSFVSLSPNWPVPPTSVV
ncbi:uncharacterized protein BO97DRAFT_129480 [Aspergillus homomorphus CBS 101889]|uniref:Uncharacterized protein n=1 Tax=Aspergillus homomorphus (strain CBS 101889) TaxID=1450537 RepID=A0A395IB24_ASPHC|nr:hypothetical protein BO97DRAFT_129480 [Aspergillus homomorphus CBS 101889]RAL16278.1 hypothetical protein BO97DRAFT_129480 [Aspergillus homomorphus CBS 101889]